ncbi:hypothetical protein JCM19233_3059 [Vibrio astriarenae]|nr:hypothetical protein JCM19233_3059 [Vibrio sp. C7]
MNTRDLFKLSENTCLLFATCEVARRQKREDEEECTLTVKHER